MKKIKRIICAVLAIAVLTSAPINAFAKTTSQSPFVADKTYTHQDQFDGKRILNGLDLSHHNGTVDFNKLKEAGVEYVILRVGARGYGKKGNFINDTKFATYYDDAKSLGLKIGAYFYSQALNEAEAIAEADKAISLLNGRELDLPLAYDYEFAGVADGRLDSAWTSKTINKDMMTKNVIAFCERVKENGYSPMLYSNKDFMQNKIDRLTIENNGYPLWLANWDTSYTSYSGQFTIWQYTNEGKVDGIKGYVDCNFMYVEPFVLDKTTVKVDSTTTNSVTLSWNSVKDATGYEIVKWNGSEYEVVEKVKDVTSATIENLEPAHNYYYRVRAYRTYKGYRGVAKVSASVKATTVPDKVKNVKLVERTNDLIKMQWDKVGNSSSYNVYYAVGDSTKYKLIKTVKTNFASIEKLSSYKKYKFRIEACKEGLVGSKSAVKSVYTRPKVPTIKSVTSPKEKQILVKWDKNTKNTGYQIQYSTTKDYSSTKKSVRLENNKATSKKLAPKRSKTNYYVRVRSYVVINGTRLYSAWSKSTRVKVK